jgi:hypothetical protein
MASPSAPSVPITELKKSGKSFKHSLPILFNTGTCSGLVSPDQIKIVVEEKVKSFREINDLKVGQKFKS